MLVTTERADELWAALDQYLKESFAALKRAAGTLDHTNALTVYKGPFGATANTRLGAIAFTVSHMWNHDGQSCRISG